MKLIFAIPFFAVLTGCAHAQFAPSKVAQSYSVRTLPEKIQLFRSQSPTQKYVEIGSVTACCGRDTNRLVDKARIKASESGGDALIGFDVLATGEMIATVIRFDP